MFYKFKVLQSANSLATSEKLTSGSFEDKSGNLK